jgi:putative addiction module component (TIGR02574 family)
MARDFWHKGFDSQWVTNATPFSSFPGNPRHSTTVVETFWRRNRGSCYPSFVSDSKRLLEEALHLPAEERAALAGALIESLDLDVDEDVEAAWSAEIGRRLERVDAGVAKAIPWSEARRRILAAAGRASNA